MSHLKPLQQSDFKMKIVKDLGMMYAKPTSKQPVRMALFECEKCKTNFRNAISDAKRRKTSYCHNCSQDEKNKKDRFYIVLDKFKHIEDVKTYLYNEYYNKHRSLKSICNEFSISNRSIVKLLKMYNIKVKDSSDAVASQWVNNKNRKEKQSRLMSKKRKGIPCVNRIKKEELKNRAIKNNFTIKKYSNSKKTQKIFCTCNTCGSYLKLTPYQLSKKHNCRTSKKSELESKCIQYFNKYKIKYKEEYNFSDLIFKRRLRFDFGILHNNKLICLIECDGIQHFKKDNMYYTDDLPIRDKMKDDYCIKNNIPLIRIPFYYIGRIEDFLNYHLQTHILPD